jgi:hypothetical protein
MLSSNGGNPCFPESSLLGYYWALGGVPGAFKVVFSYTRQITGCLSFRTPELKLLHTGLLFTLWGKERTRKKRKSGLSADLFMLPSFKFGNIKPAW